MGPNPRLFRPAALGLVALFTVLPATPAGAQTLPERGFEPVDQAVADVDPLAISLRRRSAGLGDVGQDTVVFRRRIGGAAAPRMDKLYMITPGVVAEFDRADYRRLAFAGRRFQVAQVPPNTVFHLALPRAQPPASGRADTRRRVNQRIDGRLQPLAGGQGRARSASRAGADPSGDATEAAMIFQRRQQAAVIRAIDRIVAAESGGGQAKPEP